jgi:SAM-dependent methyltransferase
LYKSRLELYKKLVYFLKNRFLPHIDYEYRTYFAHILYFDIKDMLRKKSSLLLDIGGARGEFCEILEKMYHMNCINLDPNKERMVFSPTVMAVGQNLPFKNNTLDVILCRGLLEHVSPEIREKILTEIHRTLKKDGIARIVIPPWFNPHAGHQIKPFHVLPFRLAVYLTTHVICARVHHITFNVKAKSLEELELYPITLRQMSKLIKRNGFEIINCNDVLLRNHFLARIPIVREFMIPSVAFNVCKINNHS